jgi:hypothetical protein
MALMTHMIFDSTPFDPDNQEKFIEELSKSGGTYEFLDKGGRPKKFYNRFLPAGVLWASLDRIDTPSCIKYGDMGKLKCSSYYPIYSEYLLNADYILTDVNTFLRNRTFYFDCFNSTACFVRPNSGEKTFDAGTASSLSSIATLNRYVFPGVNLYTKILLSSLKKIDREIRFVVIRGEVITGSTYKQRVEDSLDIVEEEVGEDDPAWDFIESVIDMHPFDTAYTVDVALSGTNYFIVEFNSFSHAGLYACDIKKIVDALK